METSAYLSTDSAQKPLAQAAGPLHPTRLDAPNTASVTAAYATLPPSALISPNQDISLRQAFENPFLRLQSGRVQLTSFALQAQCVMREGTPGLLLPAQRMAVR